jgi:hypothetical protein
MDGLLGYAYSAGRFRFRLRFRESEQYEETIPVNRLIPTVCTDPPEPATTTRTCTVKQRTFFALTGADSRNRSRNPNLPALYA